MGSWYMDEMNMGDDIGADFKLDKDAESPEHSPHGGALNIRYSWIAGTQGMSLESTRQSGNYVAKY
jgi:hypothetical protein